MVNKSNIRTPRPSEQIKVEPNIAMVMYLLVDNVDGHVIYFSDDDARIAKPVRMNEISLIRINP